MASDKKKPEASFEDSLKRLAEIVDALEKGDVPLEDSLRLFEEGVGLSRLTQARLDAAEKRIEVLLAVDAEGRPDTTPFDNQGLDDTP
jgi:exodeoxyribonuclease VII small subunit